MIVTQEMVDRIVKDAKASAYGLGDLSPGKTYSISQYHPKDLDALALMLVSAHHEKYDLVSIFAAALKAVAGSANV